MADWSKSRKLNECFEKYKAESSLRRSFLGIIRYLAANPNRLSWRGREIPDLKTEEGVLVIGNRYFEAFNSSHFSTIPSTVPDPMVSIIMAEAFGYSTEQCGEIKLSHQRSMLAENAVGTLLERYLDLNLRKFGWYWCCGDFVKAIDFIKESPNGGWVEFQVKNRDNSENSSSSAIRNGTQIEKWFRTKSRTGATNWDNLPASMQGCGMSEEGFKQFVKEYLRSKFPRD